MVGQDNKNITFFYVLLILSVLLTLFFNLKILLFEYPLIWIRFAIPALLFVGVAGAAYDMRYARYLGWIGIVLFVPIALITSIPTEDYVLGGADMSPVAVPQFVNINFIYLRMIAIVILSLLWVWCFWKLKPLPKASR